jgi:hypothetical protein
MIADRPTVREKFSRHLSWVSRHRGIMVKWPDAPEA